VKFDTPGGLNPVRPQRPKCRPSFSQPTTLALQIPEKLPTLVRETTAIHL
jgi:hypothetical protein